MRYHKTTDEVANYYEEVLHRFIRNQRNELSQFMHIWRINRALDMERARRIQCYYHLQGR